MKRYKGYLAAGEVRLCVQADPKWSSAAAGDRMGAGGREAAMFSPVQLGQEPCATCIGLSRNSAESRDVSLGWILRSAVEAGGKLAFRRCGWADRRNDRVVKRRRD